MKRNYYYMKKSGDVRWLYPEGEIVIKVYPREDKIISSKYNAEKDETTIKCEKPFVETKKDESVRRYRLAYAEESEGKTDEEIKIIINNITKEKRKVDGFIKRRIKSYYEIESERRNLANNCRRNYNR